MDQRMSAVLCDSDLHFSNSCPDVYKACPGNPLQHTTCVLCELAMVAHTSMARCMFSVVKRCPVHALTLLLLTILMRHRHSRCSVARLCYSFPADSKSDYHRRTALVIVRVERNFLD